MNNETAEIFSKLLTFKQHRRYGMLSSVVIGFLFAAAVTYLGGGTKSVFPQFFYIPIVLASMFYGLKGGVITGSLAGLVCGPFMPLNVDAGILQSTDQWLIRLGIFTAVGAVNGAFVDILQGYFGSIASLQKKHTAHLQRLTQLQTKVQTELVKRRKAEEQIHREEHRAAALVRIAERLNAQLDLGTTLHAVCEETARALDVSATSVSLYDEGTGTLKLAATHGLPDSFRQGYEAHPPTGKVLNEELVHVVSDRETIANFANGELFIQHNIQAVASIALFYHGKLIGRARAYSCDESHVFTDQMLSLLTGITNQAAQAIANSQLFSDANSRLERLRALREIDKTITAGHDLQSTLDIILEQVISHLRVHAADILLYDDELQTLQFAAGRMPGEAQSSTIRLSASDVQRIRSQHTSPQQTNFERPQSLDDGGYTTYHAVPLVAKGDTKGVLEIFHRESVTPNAEWLEFLEALAGQAAIAIDNVSMFEETSRANREVRDAYDAVIEGWARALALRDIETVGHTQRVTEMTVRLARRMNIPESQLIHVRRGAILHDIGKIGIPDEILLKSGPLTDEERQIMRKHPVYAYELITPIAYLKPAHHIPYYHHERWDGSGYPHGLVEEDIPKAARIFAVADVFDALTSDRPYRGAWAADDAIAYIRARAGKHFDPDVVDAFLELLPILETIRLK